MKALSSYLLPIIVAVFFALSSYNCPDDAMFCKGDMQTKNMSNDKASATASHSDICACDHSLKIFYNYEANLNKSANIIQVSDLNFIKLNILNNAFHPPTHL